MLTNKWLQSTKYSGHLVKLGLNYTKSHHLIQQTQLCYSIYNKIPFLKEGNIPIKKQKIIHRIIVQINEARNDIRQQFGKVTSNDVFIEKPSDNQTFFGRYFNDLQKSQKVHEMYHEYYLIKPYQLDQELNPKFYWDKDGNPKIPRSYRELNNAIMNIPNNSIKVYKPNGVLNIQNGKFTIFEVDQSWPVSYRPTLLHFFRSAKWMSLTKSGILALQSEIYWSTIYLVASRLFNRVGISLKNEDFKIVKQIDLVQGGTAVDIFFFCGEVIKQVDIQDIYKLDPFKLSLFYQEFSQINTHFLEKYIPVCYSILTDHSTLSYQERIILVPIDRVQIPDQNLLVKVLTGHYIDLRNQIDPMVQTSKDNQNQNYLSSIFDIQGEIVQENNIES